MPDGFRAAAAVIFLFAVIPAAAQRPPAPGQFPPYKPPHMADGHPDLNGIWQSFVTANWDVQDHEAQPGPHPEIMGAYGAGPAGQSIIEGGGEIPYQPWALQKKKQNFEKRMTVDVSSDKKWHEVWRPRAQMLCARRAARHLYAVPVSHRAGIKPLLLIAYEFASSTRIIRMNWKGEAPTPSWMGWSRGRWEGDTFVVDVTGFREETWLDRAGDFHSDELHVVERYTPVSPYNLMYEATIEDPKVYTRPWKISFPLYRRMENNVQLLEFKCVPFTEELLYGRFGKQAAK